MLDTWKHRKMHSISKEKNSKMMLLYKRKSFKTFNKEDECDKWKDWESQQKIKLLRKKRIRWKFCNWNRSSQERFGVMWNLSKDIQTHTHIRQESEEHFKRRTWGDKCLSNYRTWVSEITVDGFEVGMSGRDEN